MALETGDYLDDLVITNPTGGDAKSHGDDHLRLIKKCVTQSFPAVAGAVSASDVELSYMDGVTSAVQTQMDLKAPLASPALTGVPTAPTAAATTSTTQVATTAFVDDSFAPLASPALTGVPTAPTAATATDTSQIATTEFVQAVAAWGAAGVAKMNLIINSNFGVNQEGYTSGVITTGEYGHDMWKSISSASYTVSGGALTIVSGTLGQRNDDLENAHGEEVTISIESGTLTIGATAGASSTAVTAASPYTFNLDTDQATDFITFTAATAAYGIQIKVGASDSLYAIPEPVAEANRCYYYYLKFGTYPSGSTPAGAVSIGFGIGLELMIPTPVPMRDAVSISVADDVWAKGAALTSLTGSSDAIVTQTGVLGVFTAGSSPTGNTVLYVGDDGFGAGGVVELDARP